MITLGKLVRNWQLCEQFIPPRVYWILIKASSTVTTMFVKAHGGYLSRDCSFDLRP